MDQIEYYISYGGFFIVLIFWAIVAINCFLAWTRLRKAFFESGLKWPFHSQNEINEIFRTDLAKGYKMTWVGMGQALRILFLMSTDNPLILKPLRKIRRTLFAFVLFPFLCAFVLVVVYAFFVF